MTRTRAPGHLGLRVGERFTYEYDFTDDWLHDIRLEAILEARPGRRYPVLTGGRRSAPPENRGGVWAFLELRQQHSGVLLDLPRIFGELLTATPASRSTRSSTIATRSFSNCAGGR